MDSGILNCENGLMCVEDETSSLGGRCVSLDNELVTNYNDYDEFVSAEMHRQLAICNAADCSTSCDYLNGTSGGQKCVGTRACYGIDPTNVGCGSCNGGWACSSVAQRSLTVGEKSCIGRKACYASSSTAAITIGNDSCVGSSSPTALPRSCHVGE